MRLAAITDFKDGDLIVIRMSRDGGFGEAYRIMEDARSIANASGINPSFIAVPKGVQIEHHTDDLGRWAASNDLGIRCFMDGDTPQFSVGSNSRGVLATAETLVNALEAAYEEFKNEGS